MSKPRKRQVTTCSKNYNISHNYEDSVLFQLLITALFKKKIRAVVRDKKGEKQESRSHLHLFFPSAETDNWRKT